MRRRDSISAAAGGSALLLATLALGGAPRWSVVAVTGLVGVGIAAQLRSRRHFDRVPPLLVLLGLAAALTALQVIPLPSALLAHLDPSSYELISDSQRLAGGGTDALTPLSVDPPNTRRALLELAGYFAFAWLALRMAASEPGRRRIASAVVVLCGGAALLALLHHLAHATRLYGLYAPQQASPTLMGPLLNSNNFGGLLAMGAVLAVGLAMHGEQVPRLRLFWGAMGTLSLAGTLMTQSRGAAVALAVGLSAFTGVVALQRWRAAPAQQRRPALLRVTLPASFVVLCVLALVVYASAGGISQELSTTSSDELSSPRSKYAAWRSAAQLIEESPWIGVGRGGFEASFTRIHEESAFHTFSHLENEYLQSVVDWGIPGAAALALALAWTVLAASQRWREGPLAAGAFGALVGIAAQSAVDFGVELPAVAMTVIAIAALVTYAPVRTAPPHALRRHTALRIATLAGFGALALLVAGPWGRTLAEDHDRLLALPTPSIEESQRMMRRHPVDYLAPAEGARALFRADRPGEGALLLNHALTLHPTHPDLHRLAARALVRAGKRSQARIEYVLALRGRREPRALVEEVVTAFPDAAEAASALPSDYPHPELIVRDLRTLSRADVALRYLDQVARASPDDARIFELLAHVAEKDGDDATAERAARRLATLTPTLAARLTLGRALFRRGKLAEVEAALGDVGRSGGSVDDQVAARLLLCDVHAGLLAWERARDCLRSLSEVSALRADTQREIHRRLARVEESLGNLRRAEWERQQAERLP